MRRRGRARRSSAGGYKALARRRGDLSALLPHVPGLNSDFGRSMLSQMGIAAVFALSFNMLLGQTGLLSFGHAVYFGLGGYAAIHFMRAINHGLPIPMPFVPLAGAAAGLVVRHSVRRRCRRAGRARSSR